MIIKTESTREFKNSEKVKYRAVRYYISSLMVFVKKISAQNFSVLLKIALNLVKN